MNVRKLVHSDCRQNRRRCVDHFRTVVRGYLIVSSDFQQHLLTVLKSAMLVTHRFRPSFAQEVAHTTVSCCRESDNPLASWPNCSIRECLHGSLQSQGCFLRTLHQTIISGHPRARTPIRPRYERMSHAMHGLRSSARAVASSSIAFHHA